MKLPEKFEENMRLLLGDELNEYISSLDEERSYGIRVNTLKIGINEFLCAADGFLKLDGKVPWCGDGFYYVDGKPGRHPYYHAGLYYIQEPSAMFPAAAACCRPGDYVLDICAAPGGKSTQVSCALKGEGLLVSNDISEERTKALVKNLELSGVKNAVITNEAPAALAEKFPLFFDKVIIDAPCSGEGMFRKDDDAISSWENFKSDKCRRMQDEILEYADKMLKPGGLAVYSTCTFAPLENERTVEAFIDAHPEYKVLNILKADGVSDGMPEFCEDPDNGYNLQYAARLFPHRIRGEGHFTAVMQKSGDPENALSARAPAGKKKAKKKNAVSGKCSSYKLLKSVPDSVKAFFFRNMTCKPWQGCYFIMGSNLYYLPVTPPNIDGLKVARAGVFMGSVQYEDFKPSHPFVMASRAEDFKLRIELSPDGSDINRYLKGETLTVNEAWRIISEGKVFSGDAAVAEKLGGLCAVCAGKFVVGMGQLSEGIVKNMYPKGWRRFN